METKAEVIGGNEVVELEKMGGLFSYFAELGLPRSAEIATRLAESGVCNFQLRDLYSLAGYMLFQAQTMKVLQLGESALDGDPLFAVPAMRMYAGLAQRGLSQVRPHDFGLIQGYFAAKKTRAALKGVGVPLEELKPRWAELIYLTNRLLEESIRAAGNGHVQVVMNYSPPLAVLARSIVQYSGAPLGSIKMADKLIAEDVRSLV